MPKSWLIPRSVFDTRWKQMLQGSLSTTTNELPSPSASTDTQDSIAGTVPYYKSYIFLHHRLPPSSYPPKIDKAFSPLHRTLQLRAVRLGAAVNFCWRNDILSNSAEISEGGEESFDATVFISQPHGWTRQMNFKDVTVSSLSKLEDELRKPPSDIQEEHEREAHLYVCTHGARDCRCGDTGGALAEALRRELRLRRSGAGEKGRVWDRVKVAEVAHVGGHKYAANVLVFPFGDWLGLLTPDDAPLLLDLIMERINDIPKSFSEDRLLRAMTSRNSWRGRIGFEKEKQLEIARMIEC